MKSLEDNVEQSLIREEELLNAGDQRAFSPTSSDAATLQKTIKEQKVKFEARIRLLPLPVSGLTREYRWSSSNCASA